MSSPTVDQQALLESVNTLPDSLLPELASFIDYLSYKSAQPIAEENASVSFLRSISGLGSSHEGKMEDKWSESLECLLLLNWRACTTLVIS
jgi:hypothetical protein